MAAQFPGEREDRGARIQVAGGAGPDVRAGGGGDAALGAGVRLLALPERGEALRELRQRAAVGAHDTLLRGKRGEVAPGRGLRDAELPAHRLQRRVGVVAKVVGEAVPPIFDDVEGNFQGAGDHWRGI